MTGDSGVAKGGRGGATAPPIVFQAIPVKSLNPGRNLLGGGGGGVMMLRSKAFKGEAS